MMSIRLLKIHVLFFSVLALSTIGVPAQAKPEKASPVVQYQLDSKLSHISFSSTKNGELVVTGYFSQVGGTLSIASEDSWDKTTGDFSLNLDLLHTGLDIRDQNIKTYFFETSKDLNHAHATFQLKGLSGPTLKAIAGQGKVGEGVSLEAHGAFSLHGHEQTQTLSLFIQELPNGDLRIETLKPVVLSIKGFKMVDQLNALLAVCKHKSVADEVALSLSLVFKKVL